MQSKSENVIRAGCTERGVSSFYSSMKWNISFAEALGCTAAEGSGGNPENSEKLMTCWVGSSARVTAVNVKLSGVPVTSSPTLADGRFDSL